VTNTNANTARLLISMGAAYVDACGRLHQYWMQIACNCNDRTCQAGTDVIYYFILWRHVPTTH